MLIRTLAVAAALSIEFITPAVSVTQDGIAALKRGDYRSAHREFLSVTEHNDRDAQFMLGHLYQLGLGVTQDDTKAFQWFRRAAENGHGQAMVNIGLMYAHGFGTRLDRFKAYFWFSVVAEQGNFYAAENRHVLSRFLRPAQRAEAKRQAANWWRDMGASTVKTSFASAIELRPNLAIRATMVSEKADKPSAPTDMSPTPPSGATRVQLGAFRQSKNAIAVWRDTRKNQSDLLRGLHHHVQHVDREMHGVLHLLHVGPLADAEAAKALCDGLARRGVDCFPVTNP